MICAILTYNKINIEIPWCCSPRVRRTSIVDSVLMRLDSHELLDARPGCQCADPSDMSGHQATGPRLNILCMAISMLKIRRPLGRLIFNMGIAIPGKTVFLIETAPGSLCYGIKVRMFDTVHFTFVCKMIIKFYWLSSFVWLLLTTGDSYKTTWTGSTCNSMLWQKFYKTLCCIVLTS